ncbi:hypothetical protein DEA8626_01050 [Defluviimonas aquaemixtae]|uniref:Uncharacterized protein n=1 Tax=Albidovulum aquaemixtae TaxID=1542388 RepID=A0A2R8B4J6_9RHOB|nr:hypothetical protein [Defluviimonas aquaemixtae]SPH17527.1 hypothetical protein DEA8626_01050 [Defluviimonas aquaemixtae]
MKKGFRINFFGALALADPDGNDITPKGSKPRALLALLAEAGDMKRSRRWLESKLWSDRGPAQASGSLRQTLTEIRNAFGDHADLLGADRSDVWLDSERIETDLIAASDPRRTGREFLEGLDAKDEEFDEWLRNARAHYASADVPTPATQPLRRGLLIRAEKSESGTSSERVTGRIIADQVARNLEDRLSASRFLKADRAGFSGTFDLEIRCDVAQDDDRSVIFLRIEDPRDGCLLYSDHKSVSGGIAEAITGTIVADLVHGAATKVIHKLPERLSPSRPESQAVKDALQGAKSLAQFDPLGFDEAHRYFTKAHEEDPNGVYLAWRAFVRMAQLVEKVDGDHDAWRDEIDELVPSVVSRAPDNGLAVALVALTRIMLEDELTGPARLAEQAMAWNRNNLFARQTLAMAHSAVGDPAKAYEISAACRSMASRDEFGHLWDLYHSLVCISAGRLEEARSAAERASRVAPKFVAPRRQLLALCANAGDIAAAKKYLEELKSLEVDFTLDRYLNDPDYPVLTLRRAGIIAPVKGVPEKK